MAEDFWIERAQSAEAKLKTLQDQQDRIKEDAQYILTVFGARKKSDGSFDIDYEKFVKMLGEDQAFVVRGMIDTEYGNVKKAADSA